MVTKLILCITMGITTGAAMISVRRASDRGLTKLDWLASCHSFSFGQYHDPAHMGFRTLRVLNEDYIHPEGSFPQHPHRDMEILSYVIDGTLEHKDNLNNHSVIRRGEVQLMSAGTGIQHAEFNPSENAFVHFLQVWILPEKTGLEPTYQQKLFPERERKNLLRLIVSHDGRDGSLRIHQDADIFLSNLEENQEIHWNLRKERGAWIQVTRGELFLNGVHAKAGDGVSFENESEIHISAKMPGEFLLFDLK